MMRPTLLLALISLCPMLNGCHYLSELTCEDLNAKIIGYADANGDGVQDKICMTTTEGFTTMLYDIYWQKVIADRGGFTTGLISIGRITDNAKCQLIDINNDGDLDVQCFSAHGGGRFSGKTLRQDIAYSRAGVIGKLVYDVR